MKLTILNNSQLDSWLNDRRKLGRCVSSIKGAAPYGATYSNGEPITRLVNIGWKDVTSGETFYIKYAQCEQRKPTKRLMNYKVFELDDLGWVCSVRFYKGSGPVEVVEVAYYTSSSAALKAGIKYFEKV